MRRVNLLHFNIGSKYVFNYHFDYSHILATSETVTLSKAQVHYNPHIFPLILCVPILHPIGHPPGNPLARRIRLLSPRGSAWQSCNTLRSPLHCQRDNHAVSAGAGCGRGSIIRSSARACSKGKVNKPINSNHIASPQGKEAAIVFI